MKQFCRKQKIAYTLLTIKYVYCFFFWYRQLNEYFWYKHSKTVTKTFISVYFAQSTDKHKLLFQRFYS